MGALFVVAAMGCSAGVDPARAYGLYSVEVTRDGRTDTVMVDVVKGAEGAAVFHFTDGFETDPMGANATGLRANYDNEGNIDVKSQPVHVKHSSGELDGMISGKGRLDGTLTLPLVLKPTNLAGVESVTYELSGTHL